MLEHYRQFEIELSSDCNAACPLCARTVLNMPLKGNSNLSFDLIKSIFDEYEDMTDVEIKLCGILGDPIVHPECLEVVRYFSDRNCKVYISTNGGINSVDWWEELATLPRVAVDFCIDGYEDTNHLYRQNVKWDNVIRNLEAYHYAGGNARWQYISFDHNTCDLDLAQAHAEKLGIRFVVRTSGRNIISKGDKQVRVKKNVNKTLNIAAADTSKIQHDDMNKIKILHKAQRSGDNKLLDSNVNTIVCKHLDTPELYLSANGNLWHCCYIADTWEYPNRRPAWLNEYPDNWNNLNHHSVTDILSNEFFKDIKVRWYSTHDEYMPRCITSCGDKGAYINKKHILSNEKNNE